MKMTRLLAAAFMAAFLMPAPVAAAESADSFAGVWRNPRNSLHVKAYMCGRSMCGTVIWASEGQQEAARKAGTEKLIGRELFSEFVRGGDEVWRGKIFVPKQGKMFPGTVKSMGANSMEVRGCAFGGLLCKSQTWTKVS